MPAEERIATSTGHQAKQYWSESEPVQVEGVYQYCSECGPVLVTKAGSPARGTKTYFSN